MMWTVRIVAMVMVAAMLYVVKEVAHWAIDTSIFIWIALMAGIFSVGIMYENKDREADGVPRYSWLDVRDDLIAVRKAMWVPLSILAAIGATAYWFR